MSASENTTLRDLLRDKTEELYHEAMTTSGIIPEEKVKALERLARIIEIRKASQPANHRKHWSIVLILGATIVLVMGLHSVKVQETEIELELTLEEVRFTLTESAILADAIVLSALGASELEEIQLSRARDPAGQLLAAKTITPYSKTDSILRLDALEDKESPGMLTLAALLLPAGTHVWLGVTEVEDQYRMVLEIPEKSQLRLQVGVKGVLQIVRPGEPPEQRIYSIPGSIQMTSVSDTVTLDLTLPHKTQTSLAPYLPADTVTFIRMDQFMDTSDTFIRRVSTIQSGILSLVEFEGQEHRLKTGEILQFEKSSGQVRSLVMDNELLHLEFSGNASGIATGWKQSHKDLMPSQLEWLSAHHGLSLQWGATLYLFGLFFGIVRWWRA
jgi:hypothetical protein